MTQPSRVLHRLLRGAAPPVAVGGQDAWLHVADGMRVLDASGGGAVSCLGHGHPRVVDAIQRQSAALAASGNLGRREPYAPLLSQAFSHVSPAFAYRGQRDGETEADYAARLAAELEAEFQRLGPETVAAFVAEPVVGATAGCVPAPAWEQEGAAPDIQTVAKGLGGGYQPIGAVLASGRVVDALRDGSGGFLHGHTYLAHPVACAAALAMQQAIQGDGLLRDRFGNHRQVGDIRRRGLFMALELVADRPDKTPFDPVRKLDLRIKEAALARGLACYPGGGAVDGVRGRHVLLAPPYISSPDEIEMVVDRLGAAVDDALAGLPS